MDTVKSKYEKNRELYAESMKLIKEYTKFYRKLSREDIEILKDYKRSTFMNINRMLYTGDEPRSVYQIGLGERAVKGCTGMDVTLRGLRDFITGRVEDTVKSITQLDRIMALAPVSKADRVVFRGVYGLHKRLMAYKRGQVFPVNNFLSTSFSFVIADGFAVAAQKDSRNAITSRDIMVISVPRGTPALYVPWEMDNLLDNNFGVDEFELLFPRGAELVFERRETVDDYAKFRRRYRNVTKSTSATSGKLTFYYFTLRGFSTDLQIPSTATVVDAITTVEISLM